MILNKPKDYDEIQVNQEYEKLELGGHKGIIKSVEEYKSQVSGNISLKVEVDTDKTDKQPNYYQEQYDNITDMNKRWSTSATKYVSLKDEENCKKMLKAFITAVENSNPNFTYNWDKDIEQLKGKKVGLVFGLEEYQDQEGKTKTATKLIQFRSLDKVDNVKIPKVKLLDGTFIEYETYKKIDNAVNEFSGVVETSDDSDFEI